MLTEELALQGIRIVTNEHRDEAEFKIAQKIFEEQIFPKLEPPSRFRLL